MNTISHSSILRVVMAFLGLIPGLPGFATASETPHLTRLFTFDNDTFAHSDDDYTSGLHFGWLQGDLRHFDESGLPRFVTSAVSRLPLINGDLRQRFVSRSISHRMFTPTDISESAPIPDDVPYSALLYGTLTAGAQDATSMDAFSLSLGVVGPAAGGKWLQRTAHRIFGSPEPQGWDNQLHNEPLVNLSYEHRRRLHTFGRRDGWGGDVIGHGGFTVGNMLTSATLGFAARAGWGMADDYWTPGNSLSDGTIGSQPLNAPASNLGVWGIVAIFGSLLGNAIFWDGNTFRDSLSVHHDAWMAHLYLGIRLRYRRVTTALGLFVATVPWENPAHETYERFGSLTASYAY